MVVFLISFLIILHIHSSILHFIFATLTFICAFSKLSTLKTGSLVYEAPTNGGFEKGADHIGFIVHNFILHC